MPWIRTTPPGCGPYPNNSSASARVLPPWHRTISTGSGCAANYGSPRAPTANNPGGEPSAAGTVYDLTVVVLVAQAAHHLAAHLTGRGLGEFAAVFTLVWIAWLNGTLHHELHSRDDARGRSTFLLQILVLVPLGAFIPEQAAPAEAPSPPPPACCSRC